MKQIQQGRPICLEIITVSMIYMCFEFMEFHAHYCNSRNLLHRVNEPRRDRATGTPLLPSAVPDPRYNVTLKFTDRSFQNNSRLNIFLKGYVFMNFFINSCLIKDIFKEQAHVCTKNIYN